MIGDKIYIYVDGEFRATRAGPGSTALDRWLEVPAVGDVVVLDEERFVVRSRVWSEVADGGVDLVCDPCEEGEL